MRLSEGNPLLIGYEYGYSWVDLLDWVLLLVYLDLISSCGDENG